MPLRFRLRPKRLFSWLDGWSGGLAASFLALFTIALLLLRIAVRVLVVLRAFLVIAAASQTGILQAAS